MSEADQILLDFVEGRLSPKAFERLLYDNSDLESYLKDEPRLLADYPVKNDVYAFLIQLDHRDLGDMQSACGAVGDFLERKRIAFEPTANYTELHSLVLAAQPKWLDAPAGYVSETLLPAANGRSGKELQKWLSSF